MTREEKIWWYFTILAEKFLNEDENSTPTRKVLFEKFKKSISETARFENDETERKELCKKLENKTIEGLLNEMIDFNRKR